MTRKHFEELAAFLRSYRGNIEGAVYDRMVRDLAERLSRHNGNFDRSRFLAACCKET